jgi:DNA-binding CsgD family transcriptional regulator
LVLTVTSIFDVTTLENFTESFDKAVRRLGFTGFAIGSISMMDDPGKLFSVRWPGWIEHYAVNGFVHEDIVIDQTARSLEPFTWMDLRNRRPDEGTRVFEECSRFGWPDGFTVPVDGPDARRGLVSLAAPALLSSLTASERAELVTLSLSAYRQAFALAMDHRRPSRRLSPREREALAHVSRGREDAEIALLMSISTSTAHAHVERAKRRLGASTRAHAVALAITANLI